VGLKLLSALAKQAPHEAMAVNGINASHPPMYTALGYRTFELAQYFAIEAGKTQQLLKPGVQPLPVLRGGAAKLQRINAEQLRVLSLPAVACVPVKTPTYFIRRFLEHPFYDYAVYAIEIAGEVRGLLAMRVAQHEASRCLRIVDFMGDTAALAECGSALNEILNAADAEYLDFWQYGIAETVLARAGFAQCDPAGDVIVPAYFEPFVRKNARIFSAIQYQGSDAIIVCRADGDQDRPNLSTKGRGV
jgi:hypothetical protein